MKDSWPELDQQRSTIFITGAIFLILWFFLRSYNVYPALTLSDGDSRLLGADSYFHLRHAEFIKENYPQVLRDDPMASYPGTERGLNQGFYDLGVATLSKASLGLLSCQTILIWLAPLLSGLALSLLGAWLWETVSPWCGVLFWGTALAYPGALIYTCALGNGDHHGFEIFMFTALLLSLQRALREESSLGWTLGAAALLTAFFLGWAGAPLHLFFSGLSFYAIAFIPRTLPEAKKLAAKGALFGAFISAVPALTAWLAPSYIPWHSSYHVFLAGGLALLFGYPILLALTQKLPNPARLPVALLILASIPFLAELSPAASQAFDLFFSPRSATIAEHAAVSLGLLLSWFGLGIPAMLAAPVLLAREKKLLPNLLPLVYGFGLVGFWLYTRDFNYYATPVVAAGAAYTLSRLPWKKWTPVLLVTLAALPLLPLQQPASPWIATKYVSESLVHTDGMDQAAEWLAEYRETEGKGQKYGLLAPWDWGSALAYLSRTPVGFSQTHSSSLAKLFYSIKPEGEYEELSDPEGPFRFILIPARNLEDKFGTELLLAGGNPSQLYGSGVRMTFRDRSFSLPTPTKAVQEVFLVRLFNALGRNMGHYRLVYQSPQRVVRALRLHDDLQNFEFAAIEVTEQEAEALQPMLRSKNKVHETSRGLLVNPYLSPDVKIFEVVPGAIFVGKTKAHARVGAILSISSPHDDVPQVLTWKSYADQEGNFRLRVPYATEGPVHKVPGSTVVRGKYRIDIGGQTVDLSVTEKQVQSEAEIAVKL